jgi:hypothetical protein
MCNSLPPRLLYIYMAWWLVAGATKYFNIIIRYITHRRRNPVRKVLFAQILLLSEGAARPQSQTAEQARNYLAYERLLNLYMPVNRLWFADWEQPSGVNKGLKRVPHRITAASGKGKKRGKVLMSSQQEVLDTRLHGKIGQMLLTNKFESPCA